MAAGPFQFITDASVGDVPVGFYPMKDSNRQIIMMRTPGKKLHCQLPVAELRELYFDPAVTGSYFYAFGVQGSNTLAYRVDPVTGAYAQVGTIDTSNSGPMQVVANPTQLGISDGAYLWVHNPGTGIFVNTGQPAGGITYIDGHGVFPIPNTNQWGFTGVYDFTSIDPADVFQFTTKPGNILSIFEHIRELTVCGVKGAEVWYDAGGPDTGIASATFMLNTGGEIDFGCGAAGTPNNALGTIGNWLTEFAEWVGTQGYSANVVSPQMFTRMVNAYSTFADARSFSYKAGGHTFTQMNFPAGGESWVMDWTTQLMHKRKSYLVAGDFGRDRANCYCFCNSTHFVGDYENGKIYKMSDAYDDDDGHAVQRILYSTEKDGGLKRLYCSEIQLLQDAGIGSITTNPMVGLEISHDGGNTWGNIMSAGSGLVGEYGYRTKWNRLGSGYRWLFRFTFNEAAPFRVLGIDANIRSGQ